MPEFCGCFRLLKQGCKTCWGDIDAGSSFVKSAERTIECSDAITRNTQLGAPYFDHIVAVPQHVHSTRLANYHSFFLKPLPYPLFIGYMNPLSGKNKVVELTSYRHPSRGWRDILENQHLCPRKFNEAPDELSLLGVRNVMQNIDADGSVNLVLWPRVVHRKVTKIGLRAGWH